MEKLIRTANHCFFFQRSKKRCDNPTVRDFGFNDNTIKSQFSVRPLAGNVQGPVGRFNRISDEPLPKRKKMLCPKTYYKPNLHMCIIRKSG